jgi:hypothetical protein
MRLKASALKELVKSLTEEDRKEIMALLLPGFDTDFQAVVDGLNVTRHEQTALIDIHILNLPFTPEIFEQTYQNAHEFSHAEGSTSDDRLQSLIEVLKRANLIQIQVQEAQ